MRIIIIKPVEKFLLSLGSSLRAKVGRHIELLSKINYQLGRPFSKKIENNLYELRILGAVNVRIMYTFFDGKIYLIHGFVKTSHRISKKDIQTSRRRLKDLTSYNL